LPPAILVPIQKTNEVLSRVRDDTAKGVPCADVAGGTIRAGGEIVPGCEIGGRK